MVARREAKVKEMATKNKIQVENEKDKMTKPSAENSKAKDKTSTEPLAGILKSKMRQ